MMKFRGLLFFLLISLSSLLKAQCPVVADFTWDRMCVNGMVDFTDASFLTGPGQIVSYEWDFGDGSPTNNTPNPNHNYAMPGMSYNVQLIVCDSSGCCDTIVQSVFVDMLPSASFTFNPNNACSGSTVNFNNTSTGSGLSYDWDFGDGNSSTLQHPSHVFTAYGCGSSNFNVQLTVTDSNGCSSTVTQTVTVLQQPNLFFFEANGFVFCHTDTSSVSDTLQVFNFSPDMACIASYTIDWGDGSPLETSPPALFDNTNSMDHIYTAVGYYNLTITAVGTNGCSSVFNQVVTVESNPVASLIGPPVGTNVGCAPLEVCIVNQSQNISPTTSQSIDWGDGIVQPLPPSSAGDTICHNYLISGCVGGAMTSYTITLVAQNACDYSESSWSPVRVYEPPEAEFYLVDDSVCVDEDAIFVNISEPNFCAASSATWYTWDFGDGTTQGPTLVPAGTNPQQTVTHAYGDTGVYVVTLTAENNSTNGCGATQYQALVYVSDAVAEFGWDTVCYGDITHFTDSSSGIYANLVGWEWNFGDGTGSNQQNPNHIFPSWGDYTVWLAVTNEAGCTDTVFHIVHVDTLPYVEFAYDTVCFGDSTHFTNLSYGRGHPIIGYTWDFGDGNGSTDTDPTHIYAAPGSYNVTLIAIDSKGCIDSISHTVIVSPPPIANFSADTACLGYPTSFTDLSTVTFGTIVYWDWNFGDGIGSSNLQNPTYIYGDSGTYYVTLIVETNIGCTDTISLPIYVSPNPTAEFSFDTVCAGEATTFWDASSGNGWPITAWEWNFGDGGTATGANQSYVYSNPGSYIVTLIVYNQFGCTDTIQYTVSVDSIPEANFTAIPVCLNDTTWFYDTSIPHGGPIISWEWDFGDGNTSNLQNPTHIYGSDGIFNVTLIVTSINGCADTISLPYEIFPLPNAGFSVLSACEGDPVVFTDTSLANGGVIISWEWDFADGIGTSNLQNPTYIYGDTGTYWVTLIVINSNGCTDTVMQPVSYLPRPIADFMSDTSCAGLPVNFTDLTDPNGSILGTWEWDFGDGNTSNLQNPTHVYAGSGIYTVTLIVTNTSGCSDTIQHLAIADSLPLPLFIADSVCYGDSTHFTDLSIAQGGALSTWTWDFGDGNTSNQQNPNHLYSSPGTYSVLLIVDNINGCSDSIRQDIIVYQLPQANFSYTGTCLNRDIFFNDLSIAGDGTINQWTWDFGDGGNSALQNPVYQYSVVDTFLIVFAIQDQYGCTDTISDSIIVAPLPQVGFLSDSVCFGNLTSFTDTSNDYGYAIVSWEWSFGDGNSSNLQNPQNNYGDTGQYIVQLIAGNASGCYDTTQLVAYVKPNPTAGFNFANVCFGDTMPFIDLSTPNSSSMQSWQYDFGDTQNSGLSDPQHLYFNPGIYNVQQVVTNSWGCTDTITQSVQVYELPDAGFMASVACIGFPTSFIDTSANGSGTINTWEWTFGEGAAGSSVQDPTYTYVSGDTLYTVTLIVTDQYGCSDTIDHDITLHPQPTADFMATAACSGLPSQFTDLSVPAAGTISGWDWDFGDGSGTSSQQNPNYTYPNTLIVQTYNVTLIAYDNNGCPDTTTQTVTVNPIPIADFIADTVCNGQATSFTDGSGSVAAALSTWTWNFGDGSGTSTQQNPNYTYPPSGNVEIYQTQLIVEDANGCIDSILIPVQVNPLPVVHFGASSACTGDATFFSDSSWSNGGVVTQWSWDFGDGTGTSNQQNPAYTYDTVLNPTNYNVILQATDINGCIHDTTISIIVNPLPNAWFNSISACSGFPSQFLDSSWSTGGNIITWDWDFGDGIGTSNQQNPFYQYPTTTGVIIYNVELEVTDQNGCIDSVILPATIFPSPVAGFISDTVCSNDLVQFTDTSSSIGGAITSWTWDFGDGIGNSSNQNPSYLYDTVYNTTPYPVTLIVENINGCFDTITWNALVYPNPVVAFFADTACFGNPTNFLDQTYSNGGNLQNWSWDFGDGSGTSTQQNPDYTYPAPGFYQVDLTVTDEHSCATDFTQNVFVDSLPIPDFSFDITCTQGIVNFTNLSDGNGSIITGYLWDFDDLNMSAQTNPSHYFNPNGTYNVTLYVYNNRGCSDSITYPVTIEPGLEWDFTAADVCLNEVTQFNDFAVNPNVPAVTWLWNFGDGNTSTLEDPTHTYSAPGTYNVLLTVSDAAGCTYSVSHNITVHPLPVADFTATVVQVGNPTVFTDLSTTGTGFIAAWDWNFGDGNTSNQQNPQHVYGAAGWYNVTLIVYNSWGCSDTVTIPVEVLPLVTAEFTFDTVCANAVITFTDLSTVGLGTITNWYWDFGDGYSSTDQNPTHMYYYNGVYTVTLTVTSSTGVSDTVQHQVLVLEVPTAEFTSSAVCEGNNTSLLDQSTFTTSPILIWNWDLADGNTNTQPSFAHMYDSAGTYPVQLVVTNSLGCSDTVVHIVNVWENPDVIISADPQEGCVPLGVQFTDLTAVSDGTIITWMWQFGDGFTSVSAGGAYHEYTAQGLYDVVLTVTTNHGCTSTQTFNNFIQVWPNPVASFYYLPNNPTMSNPGVTFYDISMGGSYWWWDFGDNTTSTEQNPMHVYSNHGEYDIMQIVSNDFGCADTAYNSITVANDQLFYIPNAMTPNGDGINDVFMPFGYGWSIDDFEMRMYDRWGNLLYVTSDINKPWDGTVMGGSETVPTGVYVWIIRYKDMDNKWQKMIGHVTVHY
ncbi:MAG: hypothetical protein C0592_03275 [Marinilabiliales bacterium]|nr:MAG: hypothetical protein C0592_03275 [Marinilabiliales bacterium]